MNFIDSTEPKDSKNDSEDISWSHFQKRSDLLDLSYMELEEKNLEVKKERLNGVTSGSIREKFLSYLKEKRSIKAVTVCFSDLEGRLHMLDYDKKHLINSESNLTFDGSSVKGFTLQSESDLMLKVDWTTFRWLPSDLFGPGKVLVFANVCDKDGTFYNSDFRSKLYSLCSQLKTERGITVNIAPEVEGFLFKNLRAEQNFDEKCGFELATMSGYFSSLPQDVLRIYIDKFSETLRAFAFQNEKDHPEVAPSQFEINFKYSNALDTADQILLYKMLGRQVARTMGFTASFLPKPISGLNGNGMHTNLSLMKDGVNLFYDSQGQNGLSEMAHKFLTGVLYYANDLCLIMNSSVNSYRRLDPAYEAPNEIKVSSIDRGSMIRIPLAEEKSARIEVRTVAPDASPHLFFYALIKAGLKAVDLDDEEYENMKNKVYSGDVEMLPANIYDAKEHFNDSEFLKNVMGKEIHKKYYYLKSVVADRCPRALGKRIKAEEVLYHHEITNQLLWADF